MLYEFFLYSFLKQPTRYINYSVDYRIYDTAVNYKVIILPAILDAAIKHPRSERALIHFDFFF